MVGRPGFPCWLNRCQYSRNRLRCHAITVRRTRSGRLPAGPQPGEPHPKEAIGWAESRPMKGLLIDGELMPQSEVFETQCGL